MSIALRFAGGLLIGFACQRVSDLVLACAGMVILTGVTAYTVQMEVRDELSKKETTGY